jgi:hypothetical protein
MTKHQPDDRSATVEEAKRELRTAMPTMPWHAIEQAADDVAKDNPSTHGEDLKKLIVETALRYWGMNP